MCYIEFHYTIYLRKEIPVVDVLVKCDVNIERRIMLRVAVAEIETAKQFQGIVYPEADLSLLSGQKDKLCSTFSLIFPSEEKALEYINSKGGKK